MSSLFATLSRWQCIHLGTWLRGHPAQIAFLRYLSAATMTDSKDVKEEGVSGAYPTPFYIADFRDWQVVQANLPKSMEAMGAESSGDGERSGLMYRSNGRSWRPGFHPEIVGTQFHPEADPEGMLKHFLSPEQRQLDYQ